MQISIAMLIFLLFSDQISGRGKLLEGEAPPSPLPVEVSQIQICKLLRCSK